MNTLDRVRNILVTVVGNNGVQNVRKSQTFEELDMDSLDLVETIMTVEDEFDIEITDDEAMGLTTVGMLVSLVDSKV